MRKLFTVACALVLSLGAQVKAADWIDLTSLLTNPNFDNNSNTGWTYTSDAVSQQLTYEAMEFWYGTFDIYQKVSGLANGKYRLGVSAFYRTGTNNNAYSAYEAGTEDIPAVMYAKSGDETTTQKLVSVYSYSFDNYTSGCWFQNWRRGPYYPNNMESGAQAFSNGGYAQTMEFEVTDGTATIGLLNETYQADSWCMFDNFTLEYYGDLVSVTSIKVTPTTQSAYVGETVQLTATVSPSNATLQQVTWSSADESKATVDENGVVTLLSAGTVSIYATATDGSGVKGTGRIVIKQGTISSDQVAFNEVQNGNVGCVLDGTKNYAAWIELYNPTSTAASLANCYLSDDADSLMKWHMPATMGVVPAKGFRTIFFDNTGMDHNNCSFDLDEDGGSLYLSDSNGKLLARLDYPECISRASYARTTDGGDTWSWTADLTPGASNAGSSFVSEQLATPVVDKNGQFFTGSLTVSVNIPSGATLRYTTDGTVPTLSNGETSATGIFSVSETTIYRFRLFQDGYIPSEVATRSYLYGENNYGAPVLSVVYDENDLMSDSIGAYVRGTGGRPGNGQSSNCNWNMDWDRPVNFEYIVDSESEYTQEVNFTICGGWSRAWNPRSFKLKGGKKFGTTTDAGTIDHRNTLNYPFFPEKPYIRNRTLQNRNGGNDTSIQLTDLALQRIAQTSGIDLDLQSGHPIVVFFNGEYLYNLNMREPNNKHYVYANYGWGSDEIDQFEMSPDSGYVQKCGDREAWTTLVDLSYSASDDATYEQIRQLLDVDAFATYCAAEFYLGGSDWPQNNIKGFRNRNDGKFRFVLFDLDFAFNRTSNIFTEFANRQNYTFDKLYDTYDADGNPITNITEEIEFVTLFLNMLDNDEFRKRFIDMFCIMGGSVYEPTRSEAIIKALVAEKNTPLAFDNQSATSKGNNIINSLKNRLNNVISVIKSYSPMQLSSVEPQDVTLSTALSSSRIYINDIEVPCNYFDGKLFYPITFNAIAPEGYEFVGWKSLDGSVTSTKTLFDYESTWQYYDQGSLDGENWYAKSYDTHNWSEGSGLFGYDGDGTSFGTTLDWGDDSSNKYPTYYFRKTITLSDDPSDAQFTLNYNVDDGFIIYVNGTEAERYNMPSGDVTFDTYSSTYNDDNPTGSITLDASLFITGENVIAVELHNNRPSSTDAWWGAQLVLTTTEEGDVVYRSTDAEFDLEEGESLNIQAVFQKEETADDEHPLCINEISAANSIYVNDYYKKADWIEIYNSSDEDIDIEGYYLSDNEKKPTKYQITAGESTASTIVPANGFLIVWADKKSPISQLHASFKLAAEGGAVLLTSPDQAWADTLHYPAHTGEETVGRYPNGNDSIYVMTTPTIEKSNVLTTYSESYTYVDSTATGVRNIYISSNNGLRIYLSAADELAVASEDSPTVELNIHTVAGQRVLSTQLRMREDHASVSTALLPPGTYVAHATDEEGNRCSIKFIVR